MNLYRYSTVAADNNSAVPDGFPEGWTGQQVNNSMREFAAAVRTHISDASYVDETYLLSSVGVKTLVRNSTTQIQINSCDATSHFTAGRRVRIVGSTTDYGFVTTSSFSSPNTLVNVTMDSGDVPTSPTQILVHTDAQIKAAAYKSTGTGNGLDADKVDGYHAADLMGPAIHAEALVNGSMLIWQRGTTGSCPAGSRTYHADRWWTNPAGAAVTASRFSTASSTAFVSPYAKLITGATSVTTCEIAGQRIESYLIPYIKTTITISAVIANVTGASLTVDLLLGTPTGTDNFATVTNRLTQSLTAITSGSTARVSHTVDISGYTNIGNGLEVKFRTPSGALDSGTKFVVIGDIQIDRSSTFSFFRFRPFPEEHIRCKRYYQKTFAYATAPAQNWAGVGSGIPAGALVIPGSGAATNPNSGTTWLFPTEMWTTPTVTTYNPRATNADAVQIDGTGDDTLTVTAFSGGATFALNASAQASVFGATAEAEL